MKAHLFIVSYILISANNLVLRANKRCGLSHSILQDQTGDDRRRKGLEKKYKNLPEHLTTEEAKLIARKERRKRTRTRSKQKNIRKDTRPPEKRPGGTDYIGEILARSKTEEGAKTGSASAEEPEPSE